MARVRKRRLRNENGMSQAGDFDDKLYVHLSLQIMVSNFAFVYYLLCVIPVQSWGKAVLTKVNESFCLINKRKQN